MTEAVRAHCVLNVPEKAGSSTLRDQLEQVQKQTGKRPALLDSVQVPEGFDYLFRLFFDIRSGASDGLGGSHVTWRDIADFRDVYGIALDSFEVEAIMAMDGSARKYLAEKAEK